MKVLLFLMLLPVFMMSCGGDTTSTPSQSQQTTPQDLQWDNTNWDNGDWG